MYRIRPALFLLLTALFWLTSCQQPTPEPTAPPTAVPPTATHTPTATPIPPTATPQIIGGVDPNTAVSPRLISYSPAPGQEAAPEASFDFLFDQPMNQSDTAAALVMRDDAGRTIAGNISWPEANGRLLRFVPSSKLEAGQRYTAVFAETATSENGDPLLEPLTIPFRTQGNLEISQIAPAEGAQEVSLDTAVTLIFNRPVAPLLISQEQANLPSPIEISPEIAGNGEWVNTSVYVWRPEGGQLTDRTSYNVRVLADVVNELSASGSQLPSDYQWQFTTTAPTIRFLELPDITTNPRDGYEHLPLDQSFVVYFNQPMNTAVTESAITLTSGDGLVPLQFSWDEDDRTVTFTPTQRLQLATRYLLTVAQAAQSQAGGTLANSLDWTATTVLPPAISSSDPADGTTQEEYSSVFTLRFVSPMSRNGLNGRVTFAPPIAGDPDGFYDSWNWTARYFGLAPSTSYTVTIAADTADPHGNTLGAEQVIRFTTAPYSPSARLQMLDYFALYRPGGNNNIWTSYRNASQLDGALYRLSTPEFMRFVNRFADSPTMYTPSRDQLVWEQTADVSGQINVRDFHNFALAEADGSSLTPGFYFVTLNSPNVFYQTTHLDARPILLANANVTLKTTPTEALIWVTELDTGRPLAGVPVVFYDENFNELFRADSDENGLIYRDGLELTPSWNVKYTAVTDHPTIFGAAVSDWDQGTSPYDFGVYTDYYLQPGEGMVYFYTDRPIYRPGQTVHFKGIVRENDDLLFSISEARSVEVRINSYDGLIANQTLDINEFGTFVGQIELDSEAVLGSYYVEIILGEDYIGSGLFDVAEYRKPTFQVNVSANNEELLAGGTIQTTAVAEFFSGGNVANSAVEWNATSQPYIFRPEGNLRAYSFYFDDRTGSRQFTERIGNGTGTTDANGAYRWELPAALASNSNNSRLYTLEATVTDIANNIVSGRTQLIIHAAEVYAGIKPSGSRIGEAGREMGLDLIAVDWAGDPVPNSVMGVEIVERRWSSVQEEDEFGNTIWRSEVEEIPVETIDDIELDGNGRASVTFTPPRGGSYLAYARTEDGRGNTAVSATYLWVYGGDEFIPWRRTSDHGMELIVNQDSFTPGDTAEILIASPFQGESTALVTIERGHIYEQEVITLNGNDNTLYRIPVTGRMAPNVFVSVLVMKGVDETNPTPDFKIGFVQFSVDRVEQELTINITADEEVLGPQETVNYTVRVTDHTGAPVEAELSAALVDLAVLTLSDRNSPPILDFFYSNRWLGVRTAVLLTQNMEAFNIELEEQIKGGGGGGGGFGVLTIREEFADTAYWNGVIQTDSDGTASFSVRLPDNLTTWRLDVRAVTKETLVGEATHDIRTTKPLLVNPQTPRFFVVGDEATIGTAVRNTTNSDLIGVQVNLDAQGVALLTSETQTITVPANSTSYVSWDIIVEDVTRVDLVMAALQPETGIGDASRPEIATLPDGGLPVYKYEVLETVGTSGQLLDGDIIVESIGLPLFGPDYTPTQGDLSVEIAPSLAAAMTEGLNYLEHYPYECTEQIVSKFLPNAVTLQALQTAGLNDPVLADMLDAQMNVALQRLYARQNGDGGWAWWNGMSDTLVTAYVVHGLIEAKASGYEIRPTVINQALAFLQAQVGEVDNLDGRFKFNRQAYLLYVLARADRPDPFEMGLLYDQRGRLDLYAQALLAEALLIQDPSDPRIETITSDLTSAALLSASGANWEEQTETHDYWNWNTDTRTTAIVLNFLAKVEPENPLTANAVRWLMAHRTAGRWQGTQETAWTLLALTEWMAQSGELEADYAYEVALNDRLIGEGTAVSTNLRQPQQLRVDIRDLLTEELNRLIIGRTDGPGNLYYTSFLNIGLPVEEVQPLDNGFFISRSYYNPDDRQTAVETAELGDTMLVRLTIVVPQTRYYVTIDDPLPAGLEAIDASLNTSQQTGAPPLYSEEERQTGDFFGRGWGYWYFNHVELRDERVVIYANYLPAGTYEYTYLARAATPGVFRTIPPTAQEFYFPDVHGRGSGSLFTITQP